MEKAIISMKGQDVIINYDDEKGLVHLLGGGWNLKFGRDELEYVHSIVASLRLRAIQVAGKKMKEEARVFREHKG